MKTCATCGLVTDSGELTCPVCGHRMPLKWNVSERTVRKAGLALLIPVLAYIAMVAIFR